ncbi:XdhC family protein [Cohnella lupini]|uniref:Molybdenum cofactor sulfurylase n=1 Tax=Cohnella lupini TaxID=1294267 RepID=A0A3D9IVV4_9BACL|nr:XdhC/CoxI family protein [Cohnella lupini]RED65978.1 molybdenum cofactor sulfurylase [Cohnella lupini]
MDGYSILTYAHQVGKPAVLATLVHTEGHSYRKVGASMLLLPGGGKIGSLSPGCLESDLWERVNELLLAGEAELVTYNMKPEEDAIWGEAIGCGGIVRILLEPLDDRSLASLAEAYVAVSAGNEVEMIRFPAGKRFDYEFVPVHGGTQPLRTALPTRDNRRNPLFSTVFKPRPRLFVYGADEGTKPIVRLATSVGFRVAVGDWRSSLCNDRRFPEAELAVGSPMEIATALGLDASDYFLICSHQLRMDREMLEHALPMRPGYIGVMGSQNRIRHLLEGLPGTDIISAPVGVDIGAEGSEEIAVSIAAQLIAARKDRQSRRGVSGIAYRWDLYGSGAEQEDGGTQAFLGACAR